jgi:hypothetical protein
MWLSRTSLLTPRGITGTWSPKGVVLKGIVFGPGGGGTFSVSGFAQHRIAIFGQYWLKRMPKYGCDYFSEPEAVVDGPLHFVDAGGSVFADLLLKQEVFSGKRRLTSGSSITPLAKSGPGPPLARRTDVVDIAGQGNPPRVPSVTRGQHHRALWPGARRFSKVRFILDPTKHLRIDLQFVIRIRLEGGALFHCDPTKGAKPLVVDMPQWSIWTWTHP